MAKKKDELERPKIPGYIDMSKVNSASAGVAAARDAVNNLNYDTFKQGTAYGNLKKSYEQQGQTAMKDTLGQVAARTGGMASSYATSAANQSYNNYMQTLEDAARSMFNDEYSKKMDAYNMAQQEYNNEWNRYQNEYSQAWDKYDAENSAFVSDRAHNYQVGRDEKADSDAAKEAAQDEVMAIWQAGGTPSIELLQAAGWYDAAVDGGLSATGAAYKYGIDANDASNEIEAMIKNGSSLEEIEQEFGIGTDGKTWESVTGMSKDEWQVAANDISSEATNTFIKSHNAESIAKRFVVEGDNITDNEKAAIDYYYGTGTAESVLSFVSSTDFLASMTDLEQNHHFEQHVEEFYSLLPDNLPDELIYPYIEKHYPKAYATIYKYTKEEE